MPHVTNAPVRAYAHCGNARCDGYQQVEVDAVRRETGMTYFDLGGDLPGFERSQVEWLFADHKDAACPSCGRDREVSPDPRKQYDNTSGYDPNYLVSRGAKRFDPSRPSQEEDPRVRELEAKLAEMGGKFDALIAKLGDGE